MGKPTNDEATFIHTVFFWLHEEVTEDQKSDFELNGLGELIKLKDVHRGYYGRPAMTPRDVVDNSYDFALVCHFKSAAEQDLYQVDPDHDVFVDKYKGLWKKVQVYDTLI